MSEAEREAREIVDRVFLIGAENGKCPHDDFSGYTCTDCWQDAIASALSKRDGEIERLTDELGKFNTSYYYELEKKNTTLITHLSAAREALAQIVAVETKAFRIQSDEMRSIAKAALTSTEAGGERQA